MRWEEAGAMPAAALHGSSGSSSASNTYAAQLTVSRVLSKAIVTAGSSRPDLPLGADLQKWVTSNRA